MTKRGVGKPRDLEKQYNSEVHDKELLQLMMVEGKTLYEVCAKWRIALTHFRKWREENPKFDSLYKVCELGPIAYLLNEARKNLYLKKGDSFNAVLWSMLMRIGKMNTDERRLDLPELAVLKDHKAESIFIKKALAEGRITPREAKTIQDTIATAAKVEEYTEMKKQFEELKAKLDGNS